MGQFLFLAETSEPWKEHGLRALPTAFSLGRFRGLFVTAEQEFHHPLTASRGEQRAARRLGVKSEGLPD
jgi:hypothetical protein